MITIWWILVLTAVIVMDSTDLIKEIRSDVEKLHEAGRIADMLQYILEVEGHYDTLRIDNELPSLYSFKALGLHDTQNVEEAIIAASEAVKHHPSDARSWISLGEFQLQDHRTRDALTSFTAALDIGDGSALTRILFTKSCMADWRDFEVMSSSAEVMALQCAQSSSCQIQSTLGLQYTDVPPSTLLQLSMQSPMFPPSDVFVTPSPTEAAIDRWTRRPSTSNNKLRVGIVSSEFGLHPVSIMIRGLIQTLSEEGSDVELYCFGLYAEPLRSWHGLNISRTAHRMLWLTNLNSIDAADVIAAQQVDILIDLNGLTLFSGLPVFAHRPAPLQLSFLGLPTSTASPYMDYFLADGVALPAEQRGHFSEHLLLLPLCYLVNDYAQTQSDVLTSSSSGAYNRASVDVWRAYVVDGTVEAQQHSRSVPGMIRRLRRSSLLFGSFATASKLDPALFQVWMNILRHHPSSCLLLVGYPAHRRTALPNLQDSVRYHGVFESSVIMTEISEWSLHIKRKTSLDLVLDSHLKSGHSTGLDGVWAGVPTLTFGGGGSAERRAGESIAVGLESEWGVTFSLKEYEELAVMLGEEEKCRRVVCLRRSGGLRLLGLWRNYVGRKRTASSLFDTKLWTRAFTRMLQATWEVSLLTGFDADKKYHVFQVDKPCKAKCQEQPCQVDITIV